MPCCFCWSVWSFWFFRSASAKSPAMPAASSCCFMGCSCCTLISRCPFPTRWHWSLRSSCCYAAVLSSYAMIWSFRSFRFCGHCLSVLRPAETGYALSLKNAGYEGWGINLLLSVLSLAGACVLLFYPFAAASFASALSVPVSSTAVFPSCGPSTACPLI